MALGYIASYHLAIILSIGAYDFSSVGLFEVFGTLTAGIFLIFVRLFMRQANLSKVKPPATYTNWPITGIILLIVVALLRYGVLGPGLRL